MDDPKTDATAAWTGDGDVRALARRAIEVLANGESVRPSALEQRLIRLCDAFLEDRDDPRHEALLRIRQDGVDLDGIIDHLLPEVARIMGRRWGDDEISFADVTIGAARLQEAVRALSNKQSARSQVAGMEGRSDRAGHAAPKVLLIVPRAEHHTLGIFVASDQFRRLGYEVDVALDLHPRQIVEKLRRTPYVMVGITASSRRTLALARELVEKIRTAVTRVTPIVLGGSVLDLDARACSVVGADHVARTAAAALRKCGLPVLSASAAAEEKAIENVGG